MDAPQCCRMVLVPLPWRAFSVEAAMSVVRMSLKESDVRFTSDTARVWDWPISERGCSYEAFKRSTHSRVVGAAWADQFGQAWHLRYTFSPDHGKAVEQELLTARDGRKPEPG
jgi:hypothetical protein